MRDCTWHSPRLVLLFSVLQTARTPLQLASVSSAVCISTPQRFVYSLLPVSASPVRAGEEEKNGLGVSCF